MDRRSFIGTGTASLVGAVTPGAVPPGAAAVAEGDVLVVPDTPDRLDAYLEAVDRRMVALRSWSLTDHFGVAPADAAEVDALGRGILSTLYFTGMIGDLPTDLQVQPQVQRRIHAAAPVMDDAIEGTLDLLRSRTPAQLGRVQQALRTTDAGARIIAGFDRVAERNAVSERRRRHTLLLLTDVEWRLRSQPAATLVGEYIDKVERLTATDIATEARLQELAARIGKDAVLRHQSTRDSRLRRGLSVMGFGVATFVVGALMVQSSLDAGLLVGTVGALTFLVGLIILIVGAATPAGE